MSETNKSWTGNIQTTEQKPKGHIDSGSDSNKTTEVMTTKEVNQNCKDGDKENRPFIGGKLETLMKKLKQELVSSLILLFCTRKLYWGGGVP